MGREIKRQHFNTLSGVAAAMGSVLVAIGGTLIVGHLWGAVVLLLTGGSVVAVPTIVSSRREIRSEVEDERLRAARELMEARGQGNQNALATLVHMTHQLIDIPPENDLRVTLMKVDQSKRPPELVQVARCTPSAKSPSKTTMTIHQGVAGRCYRTTEGKVESIVVNLPEGNFIEQMVDFGFERNEARELEKRGSFVCTPIIDSDKNVIAVLCVDTAVPNVLKPEHISMAEKVTPFFSNFLTAEGGGGGLHHAQSQTGT